MPALTEYSNVYGTAVAVLQNKGFQVWYDKASATFCAEKDGWDFMSDSPCGLLGVVAIFEHRQPKEWKEYWWQITDAPDHRKLPESPIPYQQIPRQR